MQGTEQLRIETVVALVAVLLARSLPLLAGAAQELHSGRVTTRYQAARHRQTAARERAFPGAHIHHIVLLSICMLTMVERDICVRRRKGTSHPCATATQRQRGSADGAHRRLRQARTHALASTHPWRCSRAHATRWNVSVRPRNDWQSRLELALSNQQQNSSQRDITSTLF